MSNKEKDSKSFQDKLKDMFKRNKANPGSVITGRGEFILTSDRLRDLNRDAPFNTRIKTLRELIPYVENSKLGDNAVEKLWYCIEDLFTKEHSTETRHLAFSFLQSLIKGQNCQLNMMRAQFFRLIKHHDNAEDVGQRLDLLNALTCNGKDILYFEEEVGPFLLNWLPDISKAGKIEEFLSMIDNVIRFNAAYLDDAVINGLIQHICMLCCTTRKYPTVMSCLQIMSSIVAYSNMSPSSLPIFIKTLCRTFIVEEHCVSSWKIMKNLLGTHMGHSTLYTMCRILQEPSEKSDTHLMRGAVSYIHKALWSSQPLPNLQCPPSSVLPSLLQAVKSNNPGVAFEVILGLKSLVYRFGLKLQDPTWSILLNIIAHIILHIDINSSPEITVKQNVHETLNTIETLIEDGKFSGSVKQYYDVIESCASDRPESSILRLLLFLSKRINPTEYLWLANLDSLLRRYFKPDVRTNIRLKVLEILSNVIELNRKQYEDELIDRIVIVHMMNISHDTDIIVRCSVIKLLVDLSLKCESKRCLELLDILEKLLFRPFESHPIDNVPLNESEHCDIKCLVTGLINVFIYKIHKLPSTHAIKIYKMLVAFLEMHYSRPKIFENCREARYAIFDCFLKMRADSLYRLGYPEGNKILFSPYLCVIYQNSERGPLASPPPQSPAISQQPPCTVTYVSLRKAFKVFITCLKLERDWEVLSLVLTGLTKVLQNKSLILSKQGNNELDLLIDVLCSMVSDRSLNLPDSLNVKVSKPDFHASVLTALVNLASYHSYLDQGHQQKMISCLMKCIQGSPKTSKQCISALTICTLEMREVMVKMLPSVLLTLSKISATIHIAIPVLEFLSTLTQLPMVFTNFVADQYMAVFAISLPYTNPFKYNHYVVSLAHHVIAVWFLKCRLSFRRDFVKFITNGLQTNLKPFENTFFKQDLSLMNQDSSDRKRSSSLTERSSRQRDATSLTSVSRMDNKNQNLGEPNKAITLFYKELIETCVDLMARYAFSPCSALPRRLPAAEFLLNGGQSNCWLVGNKLITVTTSGCSQKVLKHGLCDKCWTFCSTQNENRHLKATNSTSNETSRQNSNEKSGTSVSSPQEELSKLGDELKMVSSRLQELIKIDDNKQDKHTCACWCQGWAEIYVRRPTGDMSWVMRIQNQISYSHSLYEFPLNEISTLFMPSLNNQPQQRPQLCRQDTFDENYSNEDDLPTTVYTAVSGPGSPKLSPSRQNSQDSIDEDLEYIYDDGTKSRNPVRRSNSSPEMSGGWKNPFMQHKMASSSDGDGDKTGDEKKSKIYSKDMRVSCEAIPEEIAGTTPPSHDVPHFSKQTSLTVTSATSSDTSLATTTTSTTTTSSTVTSYLHPSLLSCHSYPGSSPPKDMAPKPYQTVPPSPNIASQGAGQPDFASGGAFGKRPTNLPGMVISTLAPLSGKPPQSPTQTSPRMSRHSISGASKDRAGTEIQKSLSSSIIDKSSSRISITLARELAKERKNSGSVERLSTLDPNQSLKRDRGHTISVMSPAARKPRSEHVRQPPPTRSKDVPKSGINPAFVFLQLYHAAYFGSENERPLLVGSSVPVQRAMNVLDQIPPYDNHKISVLYVREGQINSEVQILKNRFGSLRYVDFLQNLGTLVKLSDVDPQVFFLGGLDQHGGDGKFTYIWQDDLTRVTFHVATMMPNKESDPNCNNKKCHIGNNYVTIVYNESGEEFNISTIKGQFNFASIIIQPLDHNTNKVVVKLKNELTDLVHVGEPKIVSDQNVAILARQLALHANLASHVANSLKNKTNDPYASNWLERLRKIKNVRNKILQEQKNEERNVYPSDDKNRFQIEDFTGYTIRT